MLNKQLQDALVELINRFKDESTLLDPDIQIPRRISSNSPSRNRCRYDVESGDDSRRKLKRNLQHAAPNVGRLEKRLSHKAPASFVTLPQASPRLASRGKTYLID